MTDESDIVRSASADYALRARLTNKGGFTLVELLVAVSLLSLGIFAVIGMQTVALQSNSIANQLSVANKLAQQVLEDILSWDPSLSVFTTTTSTPVPYAGFPVVPATSPITYTSILTDANSGVYKANYSVIVGTSGNGIPTGVSKIVVTVTYTYKGLTKTITVYGSKVTV